VSEYEPQYGKVMADTIWCAIVMSRAPPRVRDHVRFLPQEMLQNYATLRNAIRLLELRGRSYDQLGHPARVTVAVSQHWPDGALETATVTTPSPWMCLEWRSLLAARWAVPGPRARAKARARASPTLPLRLRGLLPL
jgi:hypothetical protein